MTGKSRSSHGALTLPSRYFTEREVYDEECSRIFSTHWLCVGRSEEIARPGASVLRSIEGASLLLVRDHDGSARCFYNVCRHRGTQLCTKDESQFSKSIVCPYHSWSYDLTGRLVSAPNMDQVDGFDPDHWGLRPVRIAECQGFLLVNFATDPRPPETALGPLVGRLSDWSVSELVLAHRLRYEVVCNWKLLFQNYNECYHCPRVHPSLNAISSYDTAANDYDEGAVLGGPMVLADRVASMTNDGSACGQILPNLSEQDRRRVYYFSVFPTMFVSPHPDFVMTHRLGRIAPDRTRIVCDFLFLPEDIDRGDFDPSPAVEFWDQTNRQDWHVCELSQRGVSSRGYEPGPYSNLECTLAAFDRHYLQVMGAAG